MANRIGMTLVIVILGLGFIVSCRAAETPILSDQERTLNAKQILVTDSRLKIWRIGVEISGDSLRVFGRVPDLATKEHLDRLMLTMPGVHTVDNDCHIVAPEDPAIVTIQQLMRGDKLDKAIPTPSLSVPSRQSEPVYVRETRTPTIVTPTAQVKQQKTVATVPHQTAPVEKKTVSLYEPGNFSTAEMNADQLKDRINAILVKDTRFAGLSWQADAKSIRLVGQVQKSKWITEVGEQLLAIGGGRFIDVGEVQALSY